MSLARKRLAKALRVRMGVSKGPWNREDAILDEIGRLLTEVRARSSVPANQILVTDTGAGFIRRMVEIASALPRDQWELRISRWSR